jgi:hypothetical protein
MKKLIVVLLAVSASFGTFAQTTKPAPKKETASQVKYTCPMHPEYVSDKPGKCPKCGMTLVKKTTKAAMDTTKSKKKMTM